MQGWCGVVLGPLVKKKKKKLCGYENLLKPLKPLQRFGTGMQWILVAPAFAANENKSKREKLDFVTKLHF